jgi:alpha,alpha-trehalase
LQFPKDILKELSLLNLRAISLPIFLSLSALLGPGAASHAETAAVATIPAATQSLCERLLVESSLSHGLLLKEARRLRVFDDFKFLADLRKKDLSSAEIALAHDRALVAESSGGRKAYLRTMILELFDRRPELTDASESLTSPRWTLAPESPHRPTVNHIESMWRHLVKMTPQESKGSLISVPHPILIPGARFQEAYYWDSYFAIQGLLFTNRIDLSFQQIENFLYLIERHGHVPNGLRSYYLSRSQPPVLATMVKDVVEAQLKSGRPRLEVIAWLKDRALPLLERDYKKFWMNPRTRYDRKTGLNHHWDSQNRPRPERHSSDRESELGETYRDVRAEAESGKDFTDTFEGKASQVAGVLLNSVMYRLEVDLSDLFELVESPRKSEQFRKAAESRKQAMQQFMWDSEAGVFRDYQLKEDRQLPYITADIFAPLWAGLATQDQAKKTSLHLDSLEKAGGLMASTVESGKQWDAPYGWAPHQFFAVQGLERYRFSQEARRIAQKFVNTIDKIYAEHGAIYEKIDVIRADKPIEDGSKYKTQEGFLWTNGVYLWFLDYLGVELILARE